MQSKWQNLYHSKAIYKVYWLYSQRNTLHENKWVDFKNVQNSLNFKKFDKGQMTIKFTMQYEWQNIYHLETIHKNIDHTYKEILYMKINRLI